MSLEWLQFSKALGEGVHLEFNTAGASTPMDAQSEIYVTVGSCTHMYGSKTNISYLYCVVIMLSLCIYVSWSECRLRSLGLI